MLTIQVATAIGPHCVTSADGAKLFGEVEAALEAGDDVSLDFSGVRVYSSPFFNAAIGRLMQTYTPQELNERVKFLSLSSNGTEVLRRVIENAREYHTDDRVRAYVDSSFKEATAG